MLDLIRDRAFLEHLAPQIGLSPRTVRKHLENIFQKLGVESRTAALLYVVETLGKTAT